MKFIRGNIFWECIAGPYLDLQSMATFEVAVTQHSHRIELSLSSMKEHRSSPYQTIIYHPMIILESHDILDWCKKRNIRLNHVKICYDITDNDGYVNNHTIFHYTSKLVISCQVDVRSNMLDDVLTIFHSLKSLFIEKYPRNVYLSISRSYVSLTMLEEFCCCQGIVDHIDIGRTGSELLQHFINRCPMITTITFHSLRTLKNEHLSYMASRWSKLSSINFKDGDSNKLTDEGLSSFQRSGHKFRSITLDGLAYVTYDGIKNLMQHSCHTLYHLKLSRIHLTEDEMISLISQLPALRSLDISYTGSIFYCDEILQAISTYCPHATTLILPRYEARNTGKDRILGLIAGCKNIEVLYLGYIPNLTRANIALLAKAYAHSLREITLAKPVSGGIDIDLTPFQLCQHRVNIKLNKSF